MKKTLFIIIGLLLLLNWACRLEELSECDVAPPTFEKLYNNPTSLSVGGIAATPDGAFIICGTSDEDIFLLKIDKEGNTIFFETDQMSVTQEGCSSIVITPDGGFLTCGKKEGEAYFVKYAADGTHQDATLLPEVSQCNCIIDANDGIYVYAGRIRHNNNIMNTYIGRVRLSGTDLDTLWGYLPAPRLGAENALSVIAISGGYAVAGHSYNSIPPENGTAAHFYRLNNNLEIVPGSEKFHHLGTQQDIAAGIVETNNGDFILTGNLEIAQAQDVFAFKVDQNGDDLWLEQYGGIGKDYGTAIIEAHESNQYVICGRSTSFGSDSSDDIYLSKINDDGTLVWEKTFGMSGSDESASAVLRTDHCGYIVVGQSTQSGLTQPYVVRVDADGNIQ